MSGSEGLIYGELTVFSHCATDTRRDPDREEARFEANESTSHVSSDEEPVMFVAQ
jgi:hypothetical protein